MKILFLFEGLPHYYNDILNRLNALLDTNVVVLIPGNDSKSIGKNVFQSEEGIKFKVIKTGEYTAWYGKSFLKNLKNIILSEQPDIIIAGWPYIQGIFANIFLYHFIKKQNIKLIEKSIPYLVPKYHEAKEYYSSGQNTISEDLIKPERVTLKEKINYFLITQFRRYYLNKLDAHVCYVEDAFEILESYGVEKSKIHIIYNSPDTDKIFASKQKISKEPPILPANPFRIIHVGRLVKWKKVHLLISIIKKLKVDFEKIELVVIGNGPEEASLKKQAIYLGIENHISFIGGVYDPEILGKYLESASIYVLAGVGGLSINEAMCYGKPIICSICDGTEKKLVRENFNGFFFKNDNEEDLYQKIKYLLENPDLIEKMGYNSLQLIQKEINVNTVINGYQKAFDYLATKNK